MRPVDAEEDARELGSSGADEPRQAENLAGLQIEVDLVGRIGRGAHAGDRDDGPSSRRRGGPVLDLQVAADHQPTMVS